MWYLVRAFKRFARCFNYVSDGVTELCYIRGTKPTIVRVFGNINNKSEATLKICAQYIRASIHERKYKKVHDTKANIEDSLHLPNIASTKSLHSPRDIWNNLMLQPTIVFYITHLTHFRSCLYPQYLLNCVWSLNLPWIVLAASDNLNSRTLPRTAQLSWRLLRSCWIFSNFSRFPPARSYWFIIFVVLASNLYNFSSFECLRCVVLC